MPGEPLSQPENTVASAMALVDPPDGGEDPGRSRGSGLCSVGAMSVTARGLDEVAGSSAHRRIDKPPEALRMQVEPEDRHPSAITSTPGSGLPVKSAKSAVWNYLNSMWIAQHGVRHGVGE